ncbi:MAG: 2Fe-2S iron-sulfur cluster-binding protein, partial [Candidatus Latescibacterota bacterium]|nr:2Fe-2S iron-sulfur cluster-binding protein [Candidatus Latescibacterota bacterium]
MRRVRFQDAEAAAVEGRSLFEYADRLGALVPTSCLRNGYCHECVVEVTAGWDALTPPSEAESFLQE